jgi:1,5-anhydro-D-fructose reductase (1,5-anhydro-D-mannitol-forming)
MTSWLLVGIGDIAAKRVIPAIVSEPSSRLYGVVTRDPEKGRAYAGRVWTDFSEALRDPAIDAVYVATPVALHAPQTLAALAAGKHVLCEKPMAVRYSDAEAMVRAAEDAKRRLGIAYYRRYYPKIRRAAELIEAGAIGRPVMAWATAHDWFNNEDGRRGWFLDPAMSGGGPLYDTACHRIDVFNLLFGQPVAVAAQLSNVVHQAAVEDSATVLIEYAGGVRGIVDVRRHSRVARDEFRVIGTTGELDLTPLNGPRLAYPGGIEELPAHANLHYPAVADFVAAIGEGREPAASGQSSLATDWVIDTARRSRTR